MTSGSVLLEQPNPKTPVLEVGIELKCGCIMSLKTTVVSNVTGAIRRTLFLEKLLRDNIKDYDLADTVPTSAEDCMADFTHWQGLLRILYLLLYYWNLRLNDMNFNVL